MNYPKLAERPMDRAANFIVSQMFKISDQPMQAFVGARYNAGKPENGPECGLRTGLTFLFPKQPSQCKNSIHQPDVSR